MGFSTYLANDLLDHIVKRAAATVPVGTFISLHSDDPLLVGADELADPGDAGYARIEAAASFGDVAADKTIDNTAAITFAAATGDWTTATHFGIWDAVTAGNFLIGGALDDPKTVESGDSAEFAIGELDVTLA